MRTDADKNADTHLGDGETTVNLDVPAHPKGGSDIITIGCLVYIYIYVWVGGWVGVGVHQSSILYTGKLTPIFKEAKHTYQQTLMSPKSVTSVEITGSPYSMWET